MGRQSRGKMAISRRLRSSCAEERIAALVELGSSPGPDGGVTRLVMQCLLDEAPVVRAVACEVLGLRGGSEAADALALHALLPGNHPDRMAAIRSLAKLGAPGIDGLYRVAVEARGERQLEALAALGRMAREFREAAAGLETFLDSPDELIREMAVHSLAQSPFDSDYTERARETLREWEGKGARK